MNYRDIFESYTGCAIKTPLEKVLYMSKRKKNFPILFCKTCECSHNIMLQNVGLHFEVHFFKWTYEGRSKSFASRYVRLQTF